MNARSDILEYIGDLLDDGTALEVPSSRGAASTVDDAPLPRRDLAAMGLAAWPESARRLLQVQTQARRFLICEDAFGPVRELGCERVKQLAAAGLVQSSKGNFCVIPAGRCLEPTAQFDGDEHALVHILGTALVIACGDVTSLGEISRQSVRWRAHRAVHPTIAGIYGDANLPVVDTRALIAQLTPRLL